MADFKITEVTFSYNEDTVDLTTATSMKASLYAHITYRRNSGEVGEVFTKVQDNLVTKFFDENGYVTSIETYELIYKTREELLVALNEVVERQITSDNNKLLYTNYINTTLSELKQTQEIHDRDSATGLDILSSLNYVNR